MELKGIDYLEVFIACDGKIGIKQYDRLTGNDACIFFTLDQFAKIENFVFKNKDEIELAWNEGVENDSNS